MSLLCGPGSKASLASLRGKSFDYWRRQPVLEQGHTDNLVFDDGQHRVWVSRMTLADYDGDRRAYMADRLTIERRGAGGWVRA